MPWMSSHLPHTGHELLQLGYCMHVVKHHKVSPETSIRNSRLWKKGRCFQSSLSKPHLQMLCWKEWCNRGIDSTFNKPAKQVLQKWHCPIDPFQHTSTWCKRNDLQDAPNRSHWCVMHQQSLLNRLDNQWCKKRPLIQHWEWASSSLSCDGFTKELYTEMQAEEKDGVCLDFFCYSTLYVRTPRRRFCVSGLSCSSVFTSPNSCSITCVYPPFFQSQIHENKTSDLIHLVSDLGMHGSEHVL